MNNHSGTHILNFALRYDESFIVHVSHLIISDKS